MMKKTGIFLAALLSVSGFSQDYKTRIAKTTCECFTQAKAGNPDAKTLEIKLGLCIIQEPSRTLRNLKKIIIWIYSGMILRKQENSLPPGS